MVLFKSISENSSEIESLDLFYLFEKDRIPTFKKIAEYY